MNHEEIARRVGRVYLTRCPYCGFDYVDLPPKPGVQFRCYGCSAYISTSILVDEVSMDNFEGDGDEIVCRECGWHIYDDINDHEECEGCGVPLTREGLVSERDFAGLDRPYVEIRSVDEGRKSRQGFMLIIGVFFVMFMFYTIGGGGGGCSLQ